MISTRRDCSQRRREKNKTSKMKTAFKRYRFTLITLIIAAIYIGSFIYLVPTNLKDNRIFFAGLATILTFYISILNYQQSYDKFFKELFLECNKRYDNLNDYLNSLTTNSIISSNAERQKIVDYLILCAEEYLWFKKGRISDEVWKNWIAGMKEQISKPTIRKIYEEEYEQRESYYGFFEMMDKQLGIKRSKRKYKK